MSEQPFRLAIAAVVNRYYNEDSQEALTAFRALREIADILGQPMEPMSEPDAPVSPIVQVEDEYAAAGRIAKKKTRGFTRFGA